MINLTPQRISALIAISVAVWLASGQFDSDDDRSAETLGETSKVDLPRVVVRDSHAEPTTRSLRLTARTAPAREATLSAETVGRIVDVTARRGELVAQGDLIATIDVRWREEKLDEAEARVRQREIEYQGARELAEKGFRAESQKAAALAALESAKTERKAVELDLHATVIRAPFDGVLHDRMVEVGDFVDIGNAIAVVIESDPFVVLADVAESDVTGLEIGQSGRAELIDGRVVNGTVRYIAAKADEATRTYRIELEVPNPERNVVAGMSADLLLPLDSVVAHRLPPSLLSLDADGNPGIKTVTEQGKVRFHHVDLDDISGEELLVTGLEDRLSVITTGQGFVRPGDRVDPVPEHTLARLNKQTVHELE